MDEVSEVIEDEVKIPISVNDTYENKDKMLKGVFSIPPHSNYLVIFVHGSGSGKNSERNKYLAEFFNKDILCIIKRLFAEHIISKVVHWRAEN